MNLRFAPLAPLLGVLLALAAAAQEEGKKPEPEPVPDPRRFGYDVNASVYPQKAPDEALKSVVKAIDAKRFDYLVAQIADPKYVDAKVAEYAAQIPKGPADAKTILAFDRLVRETAQHFQTDPLLIKELRAFAREGEWKVEEAAAVATTKSVPAHKVFMRQVGERWFLENRQQ